MIPAYVYTIDFETTGIDPKTAHPIEVALFNDYRNYCSFIKSPIPVPAETSAIHHIVDADLIDAPSWEGVKQGLINVVEPWLENPAQRCIFVAHNASYEMDILGADFTYVDWICTYKCALRVWPDAPNHKNETLRYWLGLNLLGRGYPQNAHSASHDAEVTYQILGKLLEHTSLEEMIEWSKLPGKLPKMPMGKHMGQTWDSIPWDYMKWCIAQKDMREDVRWGCAEEMKRRNAGVAPR